MKNKHSIILIFAIIILINFSSALSNESINANEKLLQAENAIEEMAQLGIPITRVNETYYGAKQIYDAQISLEKLRRNTDYRLVEEYSSEITLIKDVAIQSSDELKIFLEFYNESSQGTDLSEMDEDYNSIITSFEEERFEDTTELISKGYDTISELEASQTAVNAFRTASSKNIKNFFKNNWLELLIGLGIAIVLFLIFQTSIKIILVKRKKKNLLLRKATIEGLIKNLQKGYFMVNKISRLQYHTRLEKFEEMIRDINRELPLLDEKMSIIKYKKKV